MKTDEERDELADISMDNNSENSKLIAKENNDQIIDDDNDIYKFGWHSYSEITNGRFAMIGFLAIIIILLNYLKDLKIQF